MCREVRYGNQAEGKVTENIQQIYIHYLLYKIDIYTSTHYLSPLHLCIIVLLHGVAGGGGWVGSWEAAPNPSCDWMKGRENPGQVSSSSHG